MMCVSAHCLVMAGQPVLSKAVSVSFFSQLGGDKQQRVTWAHWNIQSSGSSQWCGVQVETRSYSLTLCLEDFASLNFLEFTHKPCREPTSGPGSDLQMSVSLIKNQDTAKQHRGNKSTYLPDLYLSVFLASNSLFVFPQCFILTITRSPSNVLSTDNQLIMLVYF